MVGFLILPMQVTFRFFSNSLSTFVKIVALISRPLDLSLLPVNLFINFPLILINNLFENTSVFLNLMRNYLCNN